MLRAASFCALALLLCAFDTPLPDAAQEAHAHALFAELRCVVCKGQSLADSEADVAADIRASVRQMIAHGDSDADIKKLLVSRYGEAVLMSPPLSAHTALLWFWPLLLFAAGGGIVAAYFRTAKR